MASQKKYWRGIAELENTQLAEKLSAKEFPQEIPVEDFLSNKPTQNDANTTRRDFLKLVGFSTAAAALAACEGPVVKSIPYVVKPNEITPGVPNYYATFIQDGCDFAHVLIKTREGRPIKVEVNPSATHFKETNARVQASILSLYDKDRAKEPKIKNEAISWSKLDQTVVLKLKEIQSQGKQIVLMTPSLTGPASLEVIRDFQKAYPNAKHLVYESFGQSAAVEVVIDSTSYGNDKGILEIKKRGLPWYDIDKASLIVSFGCDFLSDMHHGGYEECLYAKRRKPGKDMLQHVQIESNMSLTGANADKRIPLKPTKIIALLIEVYRGLYGEKVGKQAAYLVKKLEKAGEKALVLCGIDNPEVQRIAFDINFMLDSNAFNSSSNKLSNLNQFDKKELQDFLIDLKQDRIGAVLHYNANPLYSLPDAKDLEKYWKQIPLTVALSLKEDETSIHSNVLAPVHHSLEAWGDANPVSGIYSLAQPVIRPLFNTRQFEDSLLKWAAMASDRNANQTDQTPKQDSVMAMLKADADQNQQNKEVQFYKVLRKYWETNLLGDEKFNKILQDGFLEKKPQEALYWNISQVKYSVEKLLPLKEGKIELELYTKVGIGNGVQSNNPWLQELPDPITRTSWDNYLTVSKADADAWGLKNWHVSDGALNGSLVNLSVGNTTLKNVPVYIQPGQARGSVGLAVGYGRTHAGKVADGVGVNAYKLFHNLSKTQTQSVKIEKVEGEHEFACVQLHHTLMGRDKVLKETNLHTFLNEKKEVWNAPEKVSTHKGLKDVSKVDLWTAHDRSQGHHFNLSIDLNACTGCGACVISCHAENNVPVVGKAEIRKSRDMHWLRIDRYYSSQESFKADLEKKENIQGLSAALTQNEALEHPAENPQVAFMPVMCQHCNHAPCETVCPVAATSHGKQGQNQMAYNRCIGTRYCANNCPYKVRRFNWFLYNNNDAFDFHMNDDLGRMVLNPDVVVRSRGVMEKCSMCIQMTQAVILKAKKEKRRVSDGEFQTACTTACTSGAMVFGDINDKESAINQEAENDRKYYMLEHVGTKPNVFYQVRVRNTEEV